MLCISALSQKMKALSAVFPMSPFFQGPLDEQKQARFRSRKPTSGDDPRCRNIIAVSNRLVVRSSVDLISRTTEGAQSMATKKCPDCEGAMTGIRLIYRHLHAPLEYAAPAAKRGRWLHRFPIKGHIEGFMCGKCGRVLMYASPQEQ